MKSKSLAVLIGLGLALGLAPDAVAARGEEGYGEFPPHPLDGTPREISPKYR